MYTKQLLKITIAFFLFLCVAVNAYADFTVYGTVVKVTGTSASVKIAPIKNSTVQVFDRYNKLIGSGVSGADGKFKVICRTSLPKDMNTGMTISPPSFSPKSWWGNHINTDPKAIDKAKYAFPY